jgi:cytochrome c553
MAAPAARAGGDLAPVCRIGLRHAVAFVGRRLAGADHQQQGKQGMGRRQSNPHSGFARKAFHRRNQRRDALVPSGVARPSTILLLSATLAGCGAEPPADDPFTRTGELVALSGGDSGAANACFTCHGLDGRGDGAGTPRLAGIGVGYLNRQMEAYAAGLRRNPEMEAIAGRLSARERQAVAAYYAAMPWAASAGGPAESAPPLYARGDPRRGLWPCAACHGQDGQGVGPANPPLAGQPAAYLAEQMHAWRRSERRNDPSNMMLAISRRLTPAEIERLAAYASALSGASPRPVSPAASRAGRRAGPRNDASATPPHAPE